MEKRALKVLIVGSSRGTGRALVERLLEEGHEVTAFSRQREAAPAQATAGRFRTFVGDAMNPLDVERAVAGHDVVVVTLGIAENPLRVRLFGPKRTPPRRPLGGHAQCDRGDAKARRAAPRGADDLRRR